MLREVDEVAAKIGAVNTLVRRRTGPQGPATPTTAPPSPRSSARWRTCSGSPLEPALEGKTSAVPRRGGAATRLAFGAAFKGASRRRQSAFQGLRRGGLVRGRGHPRGASGGRGRGRRPREHDFARNGAERGRDARPEGGARGGASSFLDGVQSARDQTAQGGEGVRERAGERAGHVRRAGRAACLRALRGGEARAEGAHVGLGDGEPTSRRPALAKVLAFSRREGSAFGIHDTASARAFVVDVVKSSGLEMAAIGRGPRTSLAFSLAGRRVVTRSHRGRRRADLPRRRRGALFARGQCSREVGATPATAASTSSPRRRADRSDRSGQRRRQALVRGSRSACANASPSATAIAAMRIVCARFFRRSGSFSS